MKTALIGYTGFVGSNILKHTSFDDCFNSKNIDEIKFRKYDLVVCAGAPAVKWKANQNPQEDLEIIKALLDKLKTVDAARFVLISTVDVYPIPYGVDERSEIDTHQLCPYGKHRLFLERELGNHFDQFHSLRLPGLFGRGIKKNVLFDMLTKNMLEKINLDSYFQWYPLSRLWKDIELAISCNLKILNLAVEPVKTQEIKDNFFPDLIVGSVPLLVSQYNMQTVYAGHFDSPVSNYILSKADMLLEMKEWLKEPGVFRG